MISTVHDSVARDIKADQPSQCGVNIHRVDNFIGLLPRGYLAGSADQKGNTIRTRIARKQATSPRAVESFSPNSPVTPIVGCKDENGLVLQPQLFDAT
jgi:hypothetical protein